jgi:hypothetical protein
VYNPGRDAAERYPEWRIIRRPLCGAYGFTVHRRKLIVVDSNGDQASWDCTVAHEIVHLDRADRCTLGNAVVDERRELTVARITARRMLDVERVARCELHGRLPREVAAELGVDLDTLKAFVNDLTEPEWVVINSRMAEHWGAA